MGTSRVIFPQANSMNKIIEMIINFDEVYLNDTKYTSEYFNFSRRQGSYYVDSLNFIGILEQTNKLSDFGKKLREYKDYNDDFLIVLRNRIINRPVFKEAFQYIKKNGNMPDKDFIVNLIIDFYSLSKSTAKRRTETVINWIQWAMSI